MENYILYIVLFLIGILGTYAIIPLFKNLLIDSNVVRPNYKQDIEKITECKTQQKLSKLKHREKKN